ASVIALVAGASLAMAADLEGPSYGSLKDDIPAPTAYRWDGVYIGGHLGWASVRPKGGFDCDSIRRLTKKYGRPYDDDQRRVCGEKLKGGEISEGPHEGQSVDYFRLNHDYVGILGTTASGTESSFMGGLQ